MRNKTLSRLAVIFVQNIRDNLLKYLVANAALFYLLFHILVLRRVTYGNFAWGLHGGVDVKWSGGLLRAALT